MMTAVKSAPTIAAHTAYGIGITLTGLIAVPLGTCYITWRLYKLIHTEERWLAAVDVACGVLVGTLLGNPIIGGLSGGVFWLCNRLLIAGLWLKTLPARVR